MRRALACRLVGALALAGALAAPAGAGAQAQPRIIGGGIASPGEYPFMAFVEVRSGLQRFECGGALVAARYVVTAGHCVDVDADTADVAVGVSSVPGGVAGVPEANRFPGAVIVRNPSYQGGGLIPGTGGFDHDVAVLRLPRPAPFAQLRLPRPADAGLWAPGVAATAIGFGTTEQGTTSDDLREVALPVATDEACRSTYGADYVPERAVCAGYPSREASGSATGKDTCTGDSGGPLLTPDGTGSFVLAGVTSFGSEDCGSTYGAYAEDGSPDLAAFLRGVIPQVEVDPSTAAPFAGDPVTFTASAADPDDDGPFGGYDAIAWDLDGDGTFAENAGSTTAGITARAGLNVVAVRATDSAGNDEVRRVGIVGRVAGTVSLERERLTVREGRAFTVGAVKRGEGAGTVELRPADGSGSAVELLEFPGARGLRFLAGDARQEAVFDTSDDATVEPSASVTIALAGPTGDLRTGQPALATVTVRDDDARVRVRGAGKRRVRTGRFTLPVRANAAGRLTGKAKAGGATVARFTTRDVAAPGGERLSGRLTRRGRSLLARRGRLKARAVVRISPDGGGLRRTARRTIVLR